MTQGYDAKIYIQNCFQHVSAEVLLAAVRDRMGMGRKVLAAPKSTFKQSAFWTLLQLVEVSSFLLQFWIASQSREHLGNIYISVFATISIAYLLDYFSDVKITTRSMVILLGRE